MGSTRTERQKMIAGELYWAGDPELVALRINARRLTRLYNATTELEDARRAELLGELFGRIGTGAFIEPDLRCDYGFNIFAGEGLYMNFGCVVLDVAPVTIGSRVLFGPGVHLYTATHPTDPVERARGLEFAKPIVIGDDVWLGGHATVCPGVTIGDGAIVGAGAVVTKDVAARTVVVGNPARVVRRV